MNKLKNAVKRFRLTLIFASVFFIIMFITMCLVFLGTRFLAYVGYIDGGNVEKFPLFSFCIVSVLVGTLLSVIFSKTPLRPIRKIMNATDKIADGDYSVRLDLKAPKELRTLSYKFNNMAKELESVELLRTDFVNNFSHEFKTPIVSIRGFANALKWNDLTPDERDEYLDIIISESERLSDLSNNVLYLSKIEKQTILTDKTRFNVSEQIRLTVALLYQKICKKELEIAFDGEEFFITGNKEMMKQVWINLLDNAVKFSPPNKKISISIKQANDKIHIKIFNHSAKIPPEIQERIFDKFYQGDLSHAAKGNGLGLAIVKKVIELHGGNISVYCLENGTEFKIILDAA